MHYAVQNNMVETIILLLKHGGNYLLKNIHKIAPIDDADPHLFEGIYRVTCKLVPIGEIDYKLNLISTNVDMNSISTLKNYLL